MRSPQDPTHPSNAPTSRIRRWRWRTVDIVVASVLAVAFGVLFAVWNNLIYPAISGPLTGSPAAPLIGGVWLLPAVVGGLVIRRPGAALYTEVVAATVSMLFGSAWGLSVFLSGVWQGLGAEVVFALLAYRRWGVVAAVFAGAGAGLAMGVYEGFVLNAPYAWDWKIVYTLCAITTGVVIAGVLGSVLVRALARTGVLAPFASGRAQAEV
ncbi:energy-coupling factor transport system substrate-specific component [Haloactinopolyspora alba]|uniref:Energy-coupling factor transport system substrate-specific component n=1 Tax=Haloactinopolyspora alba TaxID=648780 RepID=A0A2P8DXD6_9ACTN|nr:ECF transporter S component [Haloactinopolyspora alba]PSL01884.1 energy-coupling factor transport system substrate-specific component [Haloactinopolyspora alba]